MKKFSTLALGLFCFTAIQAQLPKYYPTNQPKFLGKTTNDTLPNAFAGGLAHPMFGNVDINMDGREDVVVFDEEQQNNGTVLPFLSVKTGTTYRLVYAPQYTHLFPPTKGWTVVADYNGDGKKDLFCYGELFGANSAITVFKNVGTGDSVRFQMVKKSIGKYSRSSAKFDNISSNAVEIPAFADMDNDGDLDALGFPPTLNTTIHYYRNVSVDSSWAMDSLKFVLVDQCWGRFRELDPGSLELNWPCPQNLAYHRSERMHEGSTIGVLDYDADGDKDLLVGDAGYSRLIYVQNYRSGTSKKWDTAGSYYNDFPKTKPVTIFERPMPSLADVNADGKPDLIAAPMELFTKRSNLSWLYLNAGKNGKSDFIFEDSAFLERTMVDGGVNSAPCFLDFDGDGKTDLLLSVGSEKGGTLTDQVYYYKNVGTASKPVFSLITSDFLNLSQKFMGYMTLCVADLNNDGLKDLVIGDSGGKIFYYTDQAGAPGFQLSTGAYLNEDNGGNPTVLDVGEYSIPAAGDLDRDGKTDLLIGDKFGGLYYYRNVGTGSAPLFKLVTAGFAGLSPKYEAAPVLADLDGDDTLDLVLGSKYNPVEVYHNVTASSVNPAPSSKLFYNYAGSNLENMILQRPIPAIGNLDGDSFPDIVFGNARGGILAYTSVKNNYTLPNVGIAERRIVQTLSVKIYPNPTSDQLTVSMGLISKTQPIQITITDMLGKTVIEKQTTASPGTFKTELSTTGIAPGIYSIRIALPDEGRYASRQVIINR
jgi:hypothetical protein